VTLLSQMSDIIAHWMP